MTGLYLITTSLFVFLTATYGQCVEDATPSWQYIEAELDFLLSVNTLQIKVFLGYDEVCYAPIEPSEAHLDVEVRVLVVPILRVINLVDLLQYIKLVVFRVQGMEKLGLIVLAHSYEAFEHVTRLKCHSLHE